MPTKIEKDAVTGHVTTGHEWDGLQELNRPVPKWWIYVFWASVVWAVGFCVLYPSVPGITGYFHGVIGYYQRDTVDADVALVAQQRAGAMDKIKALSFADIRKDPQLLAVAQTAGRITFAENCQACHGAGGGGNPGFPALAAGNWLWGGKLEDIQQTVTFGIRSGLDDARNSQMPHFGADGILETRQKLRRLPTMSAPLYGLPVTGSSLERVSASSPRIAPCVTATLGKATVRWEVPGWQHTPTCMAMTARRLWHRSPIPAWVVMPNLE